jgi:hypothetical protein
VHAETQAQTSGFTASDASGVRQQIIPIADDIEFSAALLLSSSSG